MSKPSNVVKSATSTMSQWWKKPVYVAPVVKPLQRGPDFSFLDGRRPPITSVVELNRRKQQTELAAKVVRYLSEIKEAEQLHRERQLSENARRMRLNSITPREKGEEVIN